MRIPPYWAKGGFEGTTPEGKPWQGWAWGWSFESADRAIKTGRERARRAFDAMTAGDRAQRDRYDYLDSPMREEIVQVLGPEIDPVAIITRNRYGALVLNAPSMCFADIDFPPPPPRTLMQRLFGGGKMEPEQIERQTVERVMAWAKDYPTYHFRLYRTAAGLRLLVTNRLVDATSSATAELLESLGTDPLYIKLTRRQECFRARLTPKPWRCGMDLPPNRFPWDDPDDEIKYRRWQVAYEAKSRGFGICRLIDSVGEDAQDEAIKIVIALHDHWACQEPGKPLA